jgi:hypothetical protein
MLFSGSTISNAKVMYTIERMVYNPIAYRYGNYENQNYYLKTTGTDATGTLILNYSATLNSKKADQPIFSYFIKADITDSNGETRSYINCQGRLLHWS